MTGLQPRRSLRRKIMLVVMTATGAALLLSALALLTYELYSNRSAWVSDLQSQADLIGQSVEPTLVFNDRKAAQEALAAFRLRPQIRAAVLFDAGGRQFASYDAEPAEARPTTLPAERDVRFDGAELELTRPVMHGSERVGTVYLRARHDVLRRVLGYVGILALASAAGLALAALIFRQLHPAITRPVVAMADVSRRIIEDRNYDLRVVAPQGDDEVAMLVTAFNRMLDELATEMTERRSAEAALREADRRKDEFLATLAHELRNPLAPLRTGLALLERADHDPEVRRRMREMMKRQLTQMVRLIDDLLEVSRITRGKLELRRERTDLVAVTRQALEAADAALAAKSHAVTVRLPDAPVWVDVDVARMIQVLVNLLNNAAKYTPAQGQIALSLAVEGGTATVAVADNGLGIEPARQQSIFELFVQLDNSLERGAAGLGIGLTIARQLMQMHGGMLDVHSAGSGQGSTFTAALPLAEAPQVDEPATATSSASTAAAAEGTLDIVVADDNVDFASSFAAMLRLEGHRVRVAHDGRAALQAIDEQRPRVAFLDVGMPRLNGLELASLLRGRPSARPLMLVAVTGWGQETDRVRVRRAGFDHHLTKPIDFTDAQALIERLRADPSGADRPA
jgi:signal transduction histidine kinase/CheY-like chemotaxis protein